MGTDHSEPSRGTSVEKFYLEIKALFTCTFIWRQFLIQQEEVSQPLLPPELTLLSWWGCAKPPYKGPWQQLWLRGCCANPPQKKTEVICHHCCKVLPKHAWDFLLKVKIWPWAVQFYNLVLDQDSNREFIAKSSERDKWVSRINIKQKSIPKLWGTQLTLLTKTTAGFISPD